MLLDDNQIEFFVAGFAKTSGSKRAFKNPKTEKIIVTADNPKQKKWQDAVKWQAMQAWQRRVPWTGPLCLTMTFVRHRPKGHFGSGRNEGVLKDSARATLPETRPDELKLGRAVEDAMSGIIYLDDAQICEHHIRKVYGNKPGVHILLSKILGSRIIRETSF